MRVGIFTTLVSTALTTLLPLDDFLMTKLSMTDAGLYKLELGLGTPPITVNLFLDTISEYLVVGSEICVKCPSQVYKPGLSKTTLNTGKMWELDYESKDISFKVIEFKENICFNNICVSNQPFYTPYEQKGFPK